MCQSIFPKVTIILFLFAKFFSICLTELELRISPRFSSFCKNGLFPDELGRSVREGGACQVKRIPGRDGLIAKEIKIQKNDVDKIAMIIREINNMNCLLENKAVGFVHLENCYFAKTSTDIIVQMIMPEMKFGTLADVLRKIKDSPLETNWIIHTMYVLASSLESIQKAGVIHRDIKPENIMFADKEFMNPLFIDFGFSLMGTESRDTLGTPGFTAPEIMAILDLNPKALPKSHSRKFPSKYTSKVDVFSLGVTFLMLWNKGNGLQVARDGSYKPLEHNTNIPEKIEKLIMGMIEFDPNERMTIKNVEKVLREMVELF